ncbi:MAG: GLPGLI family protein, partial [Saprospiraceae bacterium]
RVSKHLSKKKVYLFVAQNGESSYKKLDEVIIEDFAAYAEENNLLTIGGTQGAAYKNRKENLFLKNSNILGRKYLIYDKIPKIKWTITKDQKKVGKFTCTKATTTHFGNKITAWFTDELALNNGPEEYGNLPGMILVLETNTKTITAIKILTKKVDPTLEFERPKQGKKISVADYYQELSKVLKKIKRNSGKKELKIEK